MIPTVAAFFGVSIDELFDFDLKIVDKEIERICVESCMYFHSSFEQAEKILLDGLEKYPASVRLKAELFKLYAYNIDRREDILSAAFELYGQITASSQDTFCICMTKANLIRIYEYLERNNVEDRHNEIKAVIESLPYMYPYMIQDRMRLSACYIKGKQGIEEARKLVDIEWQEFFIACWLLGERLFEQSDYEGAMQSYNDSVDVIERFMYHDKKGYFAYPIGGTHANHAMTLLKIAACLYRLGRTDEIGDLINRAESIYFDDLTPDEVYDYAGDMNEKIACYTERYNELELGSYKPLDLSEYRRRVEKYVG